MSQTTRVPTSGPTISAAGYDVSPLSEQEVDGPRQGAEPGGAPGPAGPRHRAGRSAATCSTTRSRAPTSAACAGCRCSSRRRSSSPAPAGRASTSRSTAPTSRTSRTAATAWSGPRSAAPAAAATSATSSPTARRPPASGTASTPSRWSSSNRAGPCRARSAPVPRRTPKVRRERMTAHYQTCPPTAARPTRRRLNWGDPWPKYSAVQECPS